MKEFYEEALTKRIKTELAKEIHDELGNALAVISSRIKVAKIKLQQNDNLEADFFDKTENVVDQLLTSTKDFIWTVGSSNENPVDIFYYLRDVGADLFEGAGIEFIANLSESDFKLNLDAKKSYQLILMVKEIFTNIVKHAQASRVHFEMTLSEEGTAFIASDNGIGFDQKVKNIKSGRSLGLKNLQQRADKIGGCLNIQTRPNKGTKVSFHQKMAQYAPFSEEDTDYLSLQAS